MTERIYSTELETPVGRLSLFATERGLLAITFSSQSAPWRRRLLERYAPDSTIVRRPNPHLKRAARDLRNYFAGRRQRFSVPIDLRVNGFRRRVLNAIHRIRCGQVMTYGALARKLQNPRAARAVGAATGANPIPIVIPCHRMVASDGGLVKFGGGLKVKRWLLEHERAIR